MMLMTVLDGYVPTDKTRALQIAYSTATKQPEPGIVSTYLIHATKDPLHWRIITLWKDKESFEAMRKRPEPPKGIVIFSAVGVKPDLEIFDVVETKTF
jgi:heme-degrading monooxygenase HmoA